MSESQLKAHKNISAITKELKQQMIKEEVNRFSKKMETQSADRSPDGTYWYMPTGAESQHRTDADTALSNQDSLNQQQKTKTKPQV